MACQKPLLLFAFLSLSFRICSLAVEDARAIPCHSCSRGALLSCARLKGGSPQSGEVARQPLMTGRKPIFGVADGLESADTADKDEDWRPGEIVAEVSNYSDAWYSCGDGLNHDADAPSDARSGLHGGQEEALKSVPRDAISADSAFHAKPNAERSKLQNLKSSILDPTIPLDLDQLEKAHDDFPGE